MRGDIYMASMVGDYAKPRPVIVVQADAVMALMSTVVCPLTTFVGPAATLRPEIEPSEENGLAMRSFVMVDKVGAVPPRRFRDRLGHVDVAVMARIDRALLVLLGLA